MKCIYSICWPPATNIVNNITATKKLIFFFTFKSIKANIIAVIFCGVISSLKIRFRFMVESTSHFYVYINIFSLAYFSLPLYVSTLPKKN